MPAGAGAKLHRDLTRCISSIMPPIFERSDKRDNAHRTFLVAVKVDTAATLL
jgi:hypothetical protein